MQNWLLPCVLSTMLLAGACQTQKSSAGFHLPDGDAKAGKVAFTKLGCTDCHPIKGPDQAKPPVEPPAPALGGKSINPPTDGHLVTAIVNPSYHIKRQSGAESTRGDNKTSRMDSYVDDLTVRQLIDLVAYLHTLHDFETIYTGHGT